MALFWRSEWRCVGQRGASDACLWPWRVSAARRPSNDREFLAGFWLVPATQRRVRTKASR